MSKPRYKSDMSEVLHSSAAVLRKVGVLDTATMRDFDTRHLIVPSEVAPAVIRNGASPAMSASR